MKHEPVTGITPAIFRWARETVGLSIADVAQSLKRPTTEIEDWESGRSAPTYPQLEILAYQVFHRPIAVFFLPSPPEESVPEREFRTLPEADLQTLSKDTYLHIRRAHAFQLALKDLFGERNPAEKRIWESLKLSLTRGIAEQARAVRSYLNLTIEEQVGWKTDDQALKTWRKSVEDSGVFVFKSAFKQKDISGFCLIDQFLPVIYLNNSTTKTRQIFSLLHELAHLLLSINGISKFDTSYIARLPRAEKQIEKFCNAIAAEILIPASDFAKQTRNFPPDVERVSEEQFSELAERYGVSREVMLRRFLDLGRVGNAFYESKAKAWAAQQKQHGGGNWYLNQGSYLSDRFTREVVGRRYRNQLTLEQAADYLGIKPKNFAGFEAQVLKGAGA